jgi:hypothetical protein
VNAGLNGVRLDNFTGNLDIRDSNFSGNGASGLLVENHSDFTSSFLLNNNIASFNGLDGLTFRNFDPSVFILNENTTSSNLRHGLFLNDFTNTATNGLNILNHTADANVGAGVLVDTGNGKLNILSPTISNNAEVGIQITDFTNVAGDNTVIAGVGGATGLLTNNGLGGSNLLVELTQPDLTQNVLVTSTTLSGSGGNGITAMATGTNTTLNIDIRDGIAITDNLGDGISLLAMESATINSNIGNPDLLTAPLQITNNAFRGGAGISILALGTQGGDLATVNANISNVAILNDETITTTPDGTNDLFGETTGVDIDSIGTAIVNVVVADSSIGNPALTTGQNVVNGVDISLANDNSFGRAPNRVVLDDLDIVAGSSSNVSGNGGIGISIDTEADTLSDIVISDSTIRPNASGGFNQDNDGDGVNDGSDRFPVALGPVDEVFDDTIGNRGIFVRATGAAMTVDSVPPTLGLDAEGNPVLGVGLAGPGTIIGANAVASDVISDLTQDNLTQVTLLNNTIRDFTFDGVDIAADGDARLLLNISGNTISNNGAGIDTDTDNDNVFSEPGSILPNPVPDVGNLTFFDGINIDAFEASTISARITGNSFQDNLERGLSLNTFGDATLNAIVIGNGFSGNDRGVDSDINFPGTDMSIPINSIAGVADFEAINNEEFYFRIHETTVFTLADQDDPPIDGATNGGRFDPTFVDDMGNLVGMVLGADDPSVMIPRNMGEDIFGNPIPIGQARMNLVITGNGFQLGTDIQNFAFDPAAMMVDLTALTLGDFALTDGLIDTDEMLFNTRFNP